MIKKQLSVVSVQGDINLRKAMYAHKIKKLTREIQDLYMHNVEKFNNELSLYPTMIQFSTVKPPEYRWLNEWTLIGW